MSAAAETALMVARIRVAVAAQRLTNEIHPNDTQSPLVCVSRDAFEALRTAVFEEVAAWEAVKAEVDP